jgi:hypothetical protein
VERYTEIERRMIAGRSVREIARALGCSRRTVREVRDGLRTTPGRASGEPLWMTQVDWPAVLHEVGLGHPLHRVLGDHQAGRYDEITRDLPQSLQVVPQGLLDQPGHGDAAFLHDGFDLGLGFVGDVGGDPGAHDTWTHEVAEV